MITNPEDYKGKVVKMDGMYVCNFPKEGEPFYCACIIMDATACCSQGIEFELDDTYTYPDDYPEYEDTITVIGTFDTYMDGGYEYCTLRNARLFKIPFAALFMPALMNGIIVGFEIDFFFVNTYMFRFRVTK